MYGGLPIIDKLGQHDRSRDQVLIIIWTVNQVDEFPGLWIVAFTAPDTVNHQLGKLVVLKYALLIM